ncbi:hypothetical protein [Rhodopseudomonas sp. RCAM05734]|uniref:hypothetical protein n=1 Tax=Rhodopseudomonas sp. RCAM05734 TaxID=3457549 RepID=UPI004044CD83
MTKPITRHRARQADYQRAYRVQQEYLRKPSRDDVARLSTQYNLKAASLDLPALQAEWTEACASNFVVRSGRKNKVRTVSQAVLQRGSAGRHRPRSGRPAGSLLEAQRWSRRAHRDEDRHNRPVTICVPGRTQQLDPVQTLRGSDPDVHCQAKLPGPGEAFRHKAFRISLCSLASYSCCSDRTGGAPRATSRTRIAACCDVYRATKPDPSIISSNAARGAKTPLTDLETTLADSSSDRRI